MNKILLIFLAGAVTLLLLGATFFPPQITTGGVNVFSNQNFFNTNTIQTGTFYRTNIATVGFNPDATWQMNYFPTNITAGVVLLNALTNMDTTGTKWFDFFAVITNSHGSGGPFAIVLPANVHTNITGTVLQLTNVTYVRFSGIGGVFTNGFGQPQY